MTLEDFFTLAEIKDGLTALSRVQELISVMQKEKDCVIKNAGDATRQWAAVAGTIAATENKDCLDLFVQLDGLCFINRWLKDAQKFGVDTDESFIEESITSMLRAVEKLHLDSEKSISSGIHVTVSNLLDHHSSRVQDRARILFDSWKGRGDGDAESHDMELSKVNASDKIVKEEGQPSAFTESGNDNDQASRLIGSEKSLLKSSGDLLPERIANGPQTSVSMECEDIREKSSNHLAVSSSAHEVAPTHEGLPLCTGETASVGTCSSAVPKEGDFESDVVQLIDLTKKEKQEQNVNGSLEKVDAPDICMESTKPELGSFSMGANEAKAPESGTEPALEHNVENSEDGVCHKTIVSGSTMTPVSDRKSRVDDIGAAAENNGECCSNALQDSSTSASNSGKTEVFEMSISGSEYVRAEKEDKCYFSNDSKDISNDSDSSKPRKGSRSPNIIDRKVSDNDLEFGLVDALEVARQVAQEVEREICSSSEKISEGGSKRPGSPDSVRQEGDLTHFTPMEVSSRQSHSAEACHEEDGRHASSSDNVDAEPECRPDLESSQVTEVAQDSGGNSVKRPCAFDLNEVGSDDMDVSLPVVSVSKPAPNPGLPGGGLQFEKTLGWKGSAATSAFRLASPRKNYDGDGNLSAGGNSAISKQRQNFLDIDLNVAEGEEGLVKPIAEPSGFPFGKSAMEIIPKRSSRLELDLNSIGDDGDAQPSYQRTAGQLFLGRNGHWSPSPASSSSSLQPSVRNIDLNDRPCLQTDSVDQGPSSKPSNIIDIFGRSKSDSPVISILGAKVEVGRREYIPHTLSLSNGKAIEPAVDLTMSRTGGVFGMASTASYNPSTAFGIYGPGGTVPYMVDSRGTSIVPQVGGSSSTVHSSYSQPPFILSMTGTQLGLNGIGPSRPNLDLNSGFMIESGNRDALAARQFFFPTQGRAIEEHLRAMPQPSSSGIGGKRKEPDSGWDSYPFSYKHPQPPWK